MVNVNAGDMAKIKEFNNNPLYNLNSNALIYQGFHTEVFSEFNICSDYHSELSLAQKNNNLIHPHLTFFGINCQSYPAKFLELNNFINSQATNNASPDFLLLSEIWTENPLNIPNYNINFNSRPGGRGGGVAILSKDYISSVKLISPKFFVPNILESVAIKVNVKGGFKAIILAVYRPNTHKSLSYMDQFNSFLIKYTELLHHLDSYHLPIIILGDFNCNLFAANDINDISSLLLNTSSSYGYIQCNARASRLTDNSYTLIDHIYVKGIINKIDHSAVIVSDLSDHFITSLTIKCEKSKIEPPSPSNERLINNETLLKFKNLLSSLSWNEVIEQNDTDLAYRKFFNIFSELYYLSFPLIHKSFNKKYIPCNPFMTKALLRCRNKKQELFNCYKLDPTPLNCTLYRNYRNTYKSCIRMAKKLYFRHRIFKAGKDSKQIWQTLKDSIGITKKSNKINSLVRDGETLTDSTKIADYFNEHFTSIGVNLAQSIPNSGKSFKDYLPPPTPNSFFMPPINEVTMQNYILSIKPKPSLDNNGFSMRLISKVATQIALPLSHIYNLSVQQGIFPSDMKISRAVPIFKSGDPLDPTNYRCVALIDVFSKIFEKITYERVLAFLETNKFFNPLQFGFRKNTSTFHAISAIINSISKSLHTNKIVLALLVDVQKCFDMISHEILFSKLEHYGFRGVVLKWFKSYFADRKQQMHVNGTSSSTICSILIGVLQGSILGVIMFILFINDINYACEFLLSFLFADDNTGLISAKNTEELMRLANSEFKSLLDWYSANCLLIHPKKTKALLFRPIRTNHNLVVSELNNVTYLPVYINLNNINEFDFSKISLLKLVPNNEESAARLLGFHIDEKLNLKSQLRIVHGKIAKSIYTLKQMRFFLDKKHLTLLYNAYVKSNIEYCCGLYCLADKTFLKPITILQKKAIRIICSSGYRDHTAQLFINEKILPFDKLITYNICKFVFDYKQKNLPKVFDNIWLRNEEVNEYALRNSKDFFIENVNSTYLKKHPLFSYPIIWNSLPPDLKESARTESKNIFLVKLSKFLIESIE